jgi:hypothetical protein
MGSWGTESRDLGLQGIRGLGRLQVLEARVGVGEYRMDIWTLRL